ncbi:MAG: NAD(P)-dependent oxidoreductase [Prolixibacteraceae bacterium]
MKFKQIACADHPGLPEWVYPELQKYAQFPIKQVDNYPSNDAEIIANIGDADCALVSWNTLISREVILACPQLKYIGMCCSLIDESSANVDISAASEKGIVVKGVRDYGDEGVVEFIISELIQLLKGTNEHQWKDDQVELGGQKIGIIGMGTTGQMLAEAALFFKMKVFYYSRTPKVEMENKGLTWLPLEELLQSVDILSIHLPKNTSLLNQQHFNWFGANKILINTTLGLSFKPEDFLQWMQTSQSYAIMDASGIGAFKKDLMPLERLILSPKTSGFTHEAKNRLAQKVLNNIQHYFKA